MAEKWFKTCIRIFVLCCLCMALPAQQTPAPDASAQANQQKARAVLDRMIQALGGPAYMNLQNSESTGRSGAFYHDRSEASTEYRRFWQWPDKERVELTKQHDVIELTIGDQMYEVTFRGSRTIDPSKIMTARCILSAASTRWKISFVNG